MSSKPTQRTNALLRKEGYLPAIVEKRIPGRFITCDLFGFIDILAIKAGTPVLGVQCTSGSNAANRLAKALAIPALRTWLEAGGRFEVWGWAKRGAKGKRKLWSVTRRVVTVEMVEEYHAQVLQQGPQAAEQEAVAGPPAPAALHGGQDDGGA